EEPPLRHLGAPHPAVREPAGDHAVHVLQDPRRVRGDSSLPGPGRAHGAGLLDHLERSRHPGVPLVPQLSPLGVRPRGAGRRDRRTGGVRPRPVGVPRPQNGLGADPGDPVRPAGDPGDPQLRHHRSALLAGHADRDHRADSGQRLRRLLPPSVLRQPAEGDRGVRLRRRGEHPADLLEGGPATRQAGAGDVGPAVLPDQLERLPLAGLRPVQPGEPDPPGRARHLAGGEQRPLRPPHGRCGRGLGPGADPVRLRAALHHRGRVPLRREGM
ncbi:MAG: ABC transporter, permease protein 2 (cluster 1, maltose/g3p/polyamine/iron), partial [uncultured Nocardioidaceae bacterium]